MALSKILFFSFLTIFTSCHGQEKTSTPKYPNTSTPNPTVIRNFKAGALAPDFDTTLVSQYIRSIFQDSKGNLWFGTLGEGVVRYDRKSLTYFSTPDGFYNKTVFAINEDKNGNLWFGTDQGVYKYDGKTFTEYTPKDGIGGSEIWGIYIEQSGIIWITARGSTTRFDPSIPISDSKAFTVFTVEDGLNCCVQSMYQDRSGNMWWGTGQGLYRFDGKRFYQVKQNGPW